MPFTGPQERQLHQAIGFATNVTLFVSPAAIVGLLNTVRNRVLDWALKLEESGVRGEGFSFTPEERQAAQQTTQGGVTTNFYGTVNANQLQQGLNPIQVSVSANLDLTRMRELVSELTQALPSFTLSRENNEQIRSDIATVEAQLSSPRPKSRVIAECLHSARTILENASGTVVAEFVHRFSTVFQQVSSFLGE